MRKVSVCDFTLRKISEEKGKDILFREKIQTAANIAAFGADIIELAPVVSPKEDAVVYKTVASVVRDSVLTVPAGHSKESIENAWECIKTADKPCLQIALPVATAQMEYSFRAKEEAMLENIKSLVSAAKEKCEAVEFAALDATRADRDYLIRAVKAACDSGATVVTVCDDAGICFPEEAAETVSAVKAEVSVPVFVSFCDRASMAVACAVAAVRAGADGVKVSTVGENVVSTEGFAEAIGARGADMGVETSLKLTELHRDIRNTVEHILMRDREDISESAFSAEEDIFLDSQSSLSDTAAAVRALGYDISDEDCGTVYRELLKVCEQKNSVGAKELEALVASYAMQAPSTYHLISYMATCGNIGSCMAQVVMEYNGEKAEGVAAGDGPIDSAFRAIEQSVGHHYELDDFQVQAVTRGKEALGSALVKLRNEGRLYSGNGISTDIVGASIRAYINALNKIVYEKN